MDIKSIEREEIFHQAVEIDNQRERADFLYEACQGDATLIAEIEALLEHDAEARTFLERGAIEGGGKLALKSSEFSQNAGQMIGVYKIREKIGEGGFGEVYVAEQTEPVSRRVALKIIKPGMDSRDIIARFEAERQALALMDHPNVARVFDAGTTETGRPYFVMELVHGIPITNFCDEQNLSNRERLHLFIDVCRAIQHAHQKGIIHRDLKPSNIMVTMHDDQPVPKVIDFGVAKALCQKLSEKTVYTSYGQMVGTPMYMSPEQAQMSGLDLDTRSDIYSLGVLLYELLTGTTPFDKETIQNAGCDELRRIIREDDPPRPSARVSTLNLERLSTAADRRKVDSRRLSQSLRGELDWIVMKALEKNRGRRYESASQLAEDIEHYLNDEPVDACPPSLGYRFRKFARRHRVALTTSSLVAISMIVGTIVSVSQAVRASASEREAGEQRNAAVVNAEQARESERIAKTERDAAVEARKELRRVLYASEMVQAGYMTQQPSGVLRIKQLLQSWLPQPGDDDLRGWEWHYLNRQLHPELAVFSGHERWISELDFHPNGILVASSGAADQRVRIWDTQQKKQVGVIHGTRKGGMKAVRWSPDGSRIAGSCGDGRIRIWDSETFEELAVLEGQTKPANCICWNPDGTHLAAGSLDKEIRIWDTKTCEIQASKTVGKAVDTIVWSPDGQRLVTLCGGSNIFPMYDVKTLADQGGFGGARARGDFWALAWSPDGSLIATGGTTIKGLPNVQIWDAKASPLPVLVKQFHVKTRNVHAVAWSADGTHLAVGGSNRTATIWDVETLKLLKTLRGHSSAVRSLDWNAEGTQLATASVDGTVRLWDVSDLGKSASQFSRPTDIDGAKWSPDGSKLAVAQRHELKIHDAMTGQLLKTFQLPHYIRRCDWSPDGSKIAVRYNERRDSLGVLDSETGKELTRLVPLSNKLSHGSIRSVVWHPDNQRIAVSYLDEAVYVWNSATEELEDTIDLNAWTNQALSWSPQGRFLAIAHGRNCSLWDQRERKITRQLPQKVEAYCTVKFSPDGKSVATGSKDSSVQIWDTRTGKEIVRLEGHLESVKSLSWSSGEQRLATTGDDGVIILWDVTGKRQVLAVPISESGCDGVFFQPGGQQLLAVDYDLNLHILDGRPQ